MRTRIISAFPGVGKSYTHKLHPDTTLDSDSTKFSWKTGPQNKVRDPDFPNNYIKHIKENIGKYEFIFVSSHKIVRDALLDNCLFFYLVYPDPCDSNLKDKFIQRYKERGSNDSFIKLVDENWDAWLKECECCFIGCKRIKLTLAVTGNPTDLGLRNLTNNLEDILPLLDKD